MPLTYDDILDALVAEGLGSDRAECNAQLEDMGFPTNDPDEMVAIWLLGEDLS